MSLPGPRPPDPEREGTPRSVQTGAPGACFLFVSGQLPIGPDGSKDPKRTIEQQTALVLANLQRALATAGAELRHVVKVTAYLTSEAHWEAFNAVYAGFFGDHRPARAVVPVGPLHFGFLVEVDAVAYIGDRTA